MDFDFKNVKRKKRICRVERRRINERPCISIESSALRQTFRRIIDRPVAVQDLERSFITLPFA